MIQHEQYDSTLHHGPEPAQTAGTSLNESNTTIPIADDCSESSISDSPPDTVQPQSFVLVYSVVENTSNKGKAKLFHSAGYEYAFHFIKIPRQAVYGDVLSETKKLIAGSLYNKLET